MGPRTRLLSVLCRDFKTKAAQQASKARKATEGAMTGRDPYGLFKEAVAAPAAGRASAGASKMQGADWKAHRTAHSREKMLEHLRINKHFTQMIAMREAAIDALPEALQEEARQPDWSPVPIQRRVFTETAPIPDFQAKLTRQGPASE